MILTMTVTSTNSCNPQNAISTYTVTVDPLPTASAGGTQTICENSAATISGATQSNGAPLWVVTNGAGSITSGVNGLTPVYTAAAGDAGNTVILTMTVTSTNSCNPQNATATYTIKVDPLPTATSGGTHTICQNAAYTLVNGEASQTNGSPSWTENGAGSITSGANSLTPTYTAAAADAGNAVTLTMTVTSTNTCNPQSTPATYIINVDPVPTASSPGSQTICENLGATVSGASATNGTISWSENGQGSITSGANTLTPTYTSTSADQGNAVTLTMTVTSNNTCAPQTATSNYTINVRPTLTAVPSVSKTMICENDPAQVIFTANGGIARSRAASGSRVCCTIRRGRGRDAR